MRSSGSGKTALVLSGGGMFGAYQAGAWKALHEHLKPDVVIGASIGAINGWAIAAGVDPDRLIRQWLNLNLSGVPSTSTLNAICERIAAEYQPVAEFGVTLTRLFPLRPVLFLYPDLTPRHLLASCAVPFLIPPQRIGGRLYIDGGFLGALPLWAAVEAGATRVVAVQLMAGLPRWWVLGATALRRMARYPGSSAARLELAMIAPARLLGGFGAASRWSRGNAERWVEQGERDARATVQFHSELF